MELIEYLIQVRGGREGKREADEAAKGFEHLREASAAAQIESVTLGMGLNSVSGRLKLATTAALFLGPALLSVGMSAGAALVGGGVVAGGGLMALIVGMSGFVLIGKSVVAGTKNVSTALDAYHVSVAATGRYSDQSMKALQHLDAVVATSGGPKVLAAVRAWSSLKDTFHTLTASARSELLGTYTDAVNSARKVMPLFASETNKSAPIIRGAIGSWLALFTGHEARSGFVAFGKAFREALPSVSGGAQGVFVTIMRIIRAGLPYVLQGAVAFDRFGGSIAKWSSSKSNVTGFVTTVVDHLKSWLSLIGALGHLMGTLFGQSQSTGKGLVDTLTMLVRRFDAWVASGDRGKRTFEQSAKFARGLGTALGPVLHLVTTLASAAMPALQGGTEGAGAAFYIIATRAQVFADILRFLGPLAKPLAIAFIAWKVAIYGVNAALTALDFLFSLTPLGWFVLAVVAIAAAFYLAYTKIGWFRTAVGNAFSWLKSNWPLVLAILIGPFGLAVLYIVKHWDSIVSVVKGIPGRLAKAGAGMWDFVKNTFRDALNWVIGKWNGFHIGMGAVKVLGHTVVPGFNFKTPDIPLLANGGVARMAGSAIVGEEGPEMIDLPAGAVVSPLGRGGDIVVKVDGREWARVSRRQMLAAQAGA